MTETCAFGSTFDEAGHVGEHEALLGTDTNHAEMRMERRERIVGDLGTGVETAVMKVDLPALGMPRRPTSAST